MPIPGDVGMYDIQTTLPGLVSPTSAGLDALAEFGPGGIQALLEEVRLLAANMERASNTRSGLPRDLNPAALAGSGNALQ